MSKRTADGQKITPGKIKGWNESYLKYRVALLARIDDDGEGKSVDDEILSARLNWEAER